MTKEGKEKHNMQKKVPNNLIPDHVVRAEAPPRPTPQLKTFISKIRMQTFKNGIIKCQSSIGQDIVLFDLSE